MNSEERSRCFAVAVRTVSGGKRCEGPGVSIGVRKAECGVGRPREVRALVRRGRVGCTDMLYKCSFGVLIKVSPFSK